MREVLYSKLEGTIDKPYLLIKSLSDITYAIAGGLIGALIGFRISGGIANATFLGYLIGTVILVVAAAAIKYKAHPDVGSKDEKAPDEENEDESANTDLTEVAET